MAKHTVPDTLYHAHDGGNEACLFPPGNGWYCPYGTIEAATVARNSPWGRVVNLALQNDQRVCPECRDGDCSAHDAESYRG